MSSNVHKTITVRVVSRISFSSSMLDYSKIFNVIRINRVNLKYKSLDDDIESRLTVFPLDFQPEVTLEHYLDEKVIRNWGE